MQRRDFSSALGATVVGAFAAGVAPGPSHAASASPQDEAIRQALRRIEAESGGHLGVGILDTADGRRIGHRADTRFPMCSTFKLLAAALVLHRVDRGEDDLQRQIAVDPAAILPHSPLTAPRAGRRMAMSELCEAAITQSDNAAANLMLASFGGPPGLTRYVRTLGDRVTRLDRTEPALNEALPGDPRDTTSPAAMLGLLQVLLVGTALKPASRAQLQQWLVASTTGDQRLRARLPAGWRVGDKTGTGPRGTANDIAIVWPPARPPLLVAAYLTGSTATPEQRDAALAAVGALLPGLVTA